MGSRYEKAAADYLRRQGYEILVMNYRNRKGEIDIVARDGDYLCFVEVKYRKDAAAGDPLEAVGWRKQMVICRVADHFLLTHRQWADLQIRFDVVAIQGRDHTSYQCPSLYRLMIEKRNYRSEEGYVLPYLSFSSYEASPYIRHMFTTRQGGVSKDIYACLNLSFTRGDDETGVRENYQGSQGQSGRYRGYRYERPDPHDQCGNWRKTWTRGQVFYIRRITQMWTA